MEPLGHMNLRKIVKVERPSPTSGLDPWLIFDKNRAHVEQRGASFVDEEIPNAMGDASNGFFQADWSADGWKIGDKVLDENW
jgi:hypothetical protein